ncbi:MAG: rRNA methyltransferase, partial [Arthrobacter sp.]
MPRAAGATPDAGPSADSTAETAAETEPKPEVGVGPWDGDLPEGEHWDPDLL